ncbi:hypothetical protein GOP47_0006713 [Adiantum capillus-veneris]|uniref:Protein kinase domain-containing protein n=1 Tax=Adiantum capillus-veneris TaxID=13818 RepID=A0A9D4ZMB1_ADICA|nr:hypothetical protein GOP47_0006095 [Adiantum capillus-veneris]KAI5079042.1 hypothetical protein GOP47_0006713 [Adiantum capillus-veneris]
MALTITCKAEVFLFVILFNKLLDSLHATTNQPDVSALQNLFISLNSASTLKHWSSNGTDPCSDAWEGVTCLNQAVTEIHLSGLNLTGSLGYRLDQLTSVTILDLSNNQLSGGLPYQFPPNVQQLNLGSNNFSGSGGFPFSFMSMTNLTSLNMSNNHLSGKINDVFWHFHNLITLDLSFNIFSGELPHSFSNLTVVSVMYLQNNALSGDVDVLANLPLQDLNLENNQFTGWIPSTFNSIPDLKLTGNKFNIGPVPAPPFVVTPPTQAPDDTATNNNESSAGVLNQQSNPDGSVISPSGSSSSLSTGAVAGISIAGVLAISTVAFIIIIFCFKPQERFGNKANQQTVSSIAIQSFSTPPARVSSHTEESNLEIPMQQTTLKHQPADLNKRQNSEQLQTKSPRIIESRSSKTATTYSIADLQVATGSFSEENFLGEGTYGAVYKANIQDQTVAVKKLDTSHSTFPNAEKMTEFISSLSRLHHPNITQLVGYCLEHGQCLLVHEYFEKGTLHDILHSDYDTRTKLTWNARIKIALGAARALEYLHEVCGPPVVHKNFKSINILLDKELKPHLSDSGIAAFLQPCEGQASARMAGSSSYYAPEHAMYGVYTTKTDVYGFGVVMLELLTGRIPFDSTKPRNEKSLVRWATPQLHDIDALTSMVDTALKGQYRAKSLSRFADIISLCIQPEPEFRPMMSEVVQLLVRLMQGASLGKRRPEDADELPE